MPSRRHCRQTGPIYLAKLLSLPFLYGRPAGLPTYLLQGAVYGHGWPSSRLQPLPYGRGSVTLAASSEDGIRCAESASHPESRELRSPPSKARVPHSRGPTPARTPVHPPYGAHFPTPCWPPSTPP